MVGREGVGGKEGWSGPGPHAATTTKRVVMKSGDEGRQQGVAKKGTGESGDLHQWAVGSRWCPTRERERKGDNHSKREGGKEGGLL